MSQFHKKSIRNHEKCGSHEIDDDNGEWNNEYVTEVIISVDIGKAENDRSCKHSSRNLDYIRSAGKSQYSVVLELSSRHKLCQKSGKIKLLSTHVSNYMTLIIFYFYYNVVFSKNSLPENSLHPV